MKKSFVFFICACIVLLFTACTQTADKTASPQSVTTSVALPSVSAVQPSAAASVSAAATQSAPAASRQAAAPSNTAELYSSYAHMASFDPQTGWAQFDYFDMLKSSGAVQWLVENKGYTKASAQAEVDQYTDSEFVEKNSNPQLRTVDLNTVALRMMYTPDGAQVDGAEPAAATVDDVDALYAKNPDLVLKSFFYYIKVENGKAVSVDQIYWP